MELLYTFIDFVLHMKEHLAELTATYGSWVYAILFLIVFCETGLVVTPFLPGDSLLFTAGTLAALGSLNVHLLVVILFVAAVLGDAVNYAVGRRIGPAVFERENSRLFKREYLIRTHNFFEKYGPKAIVLARFVPIVRTFAPFLAGVGTMNYAKFASYNVIGAMLWVGLITYSGWLFGEIPFIKKNFELVVLGIVVVSVLPIFVEWLAVRKAARSQAS